MSKNGSSPRLGNHRPAEDKQADDLPDVRLAVAALAAWAATLWGLSRTAHTVAAAAVIGLAITGCLLLIARGRAALYPLVMAFCGAVLALGPLALRLEHAREGDLSRLAANHLEVTADLHITSDPRPLAARGPAGSPRMVVDGSLDAVTVAGVRSRVSGRVLLLGPLDAWRAVLPGQRVLVDARLAPPLSDDLLSATLAVRTAPQLIGSPPWWQRAAGSVRAGLQRVSGRVGGEAGGLLPGLVDGDTSQLDPVLAERFRVAGLTHLVAVSGTNCSILVGSVALILRRLRASPRAGVCVGVLVICAFVVVARPSPSVLRAAVMALIALAAIASGRPRAGVPALAVSVLGLMLWQPSLAVNLGFILSAAATAALMMVAPGWAGALHRWGCPHFLSEGLAVSAAAHLVTAPIIVGISGQLSLVAVPANLLAEPVVGAATVLGVLAAATAVPSPLLGSCFAQLASLPCRWLVWVAEYFGSLPGGSIPWPTGVPGGILLAGLSLAVVLAARRASLRPGLVLALVISLVVQIPIRAVVNQWPVSGWIMVACDVGQGDALVLADGPGAAVMIDTGPDPISVDRCLRQLHITRIRLLVLSHDHLDHVGGLAGVLHGRTVERVIESPLPQPATGHRFALAALRNSGVLPQVLALGTQLVVGQVQLQVLGPVRLLHGTRSDPNNASVVLRAVVAGHSILLPGDAEVEEQDGLLASGVELRSEILKVPHHGSAYSDPAFLQAVHAQLALVSVGANNDYGHPSPLLIAEMARLGVPTYRTDQLGDVVVAAGPDGHLVALNHRTGSANALAGPPAQTQKSLRSCATMTQCRPPP